MTRPKSKRPSDGSPTVSSLQPARGVIADSWRRARLSGLSPSSTVDALTDRSARDQPVPQRELAMIKAMRSMRLRERLAVGRKLADADLLLSRPDGTPLPVRDYSDFASQRKTGGLKAITLGKLRHSHISS